MCLDSRLSPCPARFIRVTLHCEPITSIDQQGSSRSSCPNSPSLTPTIIRPSGYWPYVKSCLVEGRDKWLKSVAELARARRSGRIYSFHNSIGSASSPTNQTAERGNLRPYHQPKQMMWNPTNHCRRPSTANKPIIAALLRANYRKLFIQTALLRGNFRNSFKITLVSSLYLLADTTRRRCSTQRQL